MKEITRYEAFISKITFNPSQDRGDWVRYIDHVDAIELLDKELHGVIQERDNYFNQVVFLQETINGKDDRIQHLTEEISALRYEAERQRRGQ